MVSGKLALPFQHCNINNHRIFGNFKNCKQICFHLFVRLHVHAENNAKSHYGEDLFRDSNTNTNAYASLLQACTNIKPLNQLHAHIFTNGFHENNNLQSKLASMYAMCGSMESARLVFDRMYQPNIFLWNTMIREYGRKGSCHEALAFYYQMKRAGIQPDNFTFSFVLKACAAMSALPEGKEIHDDIVRSGLESDIFVRNSLVTMYAKCGSIEIAYQVFDKMPERDAISWNAMISGYAQNGYANQALDLFNQMQLAGMKPTAITMVSVLQAYAHLGALKQGSWIHAYIIRSGFESDVFVGNSLVVMYVKCGSINTARHLFDKMSRRDVISWNAMIAGCAQHGHANEALSLFHRMLLMGLTPDSDSIVSVLQACAQLKALQQGKWIHDYVVRSGLESNVFVNNSLVAMYAKCGNVAFARHLFDKMSNRNVVSWNIMIAGYAQNGHVNEALVLFHQMQLAEETPDSMTMESVLQVCAHLGALQQGKSIHDYIIRNGFESEVFVANSLVAMYAKCGSIDISRHLFDRMPNKNLVSWNAMIAGYAQNGYANEVMMLFQQLQLVDVTFDTVTMVGVISACAYSAAQVQGQCVHGYIIRSGFESDVLVGTAIIDMYAKHGSIEFGHQLFNKMSKKDVISWNTMVAGYSQNGYAREALTLFYQMQQQNIMPDSVTLAIALQSCAHLGAVEEGKWIHHHIVRSGFMSDVFVGTALIDMYGKCGSIEIARRLFDKMSKRNVVSWNAMIAGYAQNGNAIEALSLFHQMQLTDMTPDSVTMVSILQACAHLGALQEGKCIHDHIIQSGFESDVFVGTALVDMYAKCGSIEIAQQLFNGMSERNVASWNAMIAGLGMHGHGEDALSVFSQMQQTGMIPNHITFICVLSACSHAGLVDEGWQYFDCMSRDYCITCKMEHYACMVDLLGRAGHLDEAQDFIKNMPLEPDASVWGALLGACRIHCNIELGTHVAEHIFYLEPENTGYYVLLSNIYAAAGRWDDAAKVRTVIQDRGLKKTPGCSFIEVNNRVHAFLAGDRSHPQSEKIYGMLEALSAQMKEGGYVPNMNFVLHDVEEEMKEHMLCSHSEKLAIAFGLINISPEIPIRITKNLRVCGDCHSATKFISKIVRREIIVRDANRFHHFKDGLCSCHDYW
eukprot:Gb_39249 [translate_table: standard]